MRRQAPPCGHFSVCGRDIFFMGRVPKPTSQSEPPSPPRRGEGESVCWEGVVLEAASFTRISFPSAFVKVGDELPLPEALLEGSKPGSLK